MRRGILAPFAALLLAPIAARGGDDRLFRERVAPLLERRCVSCHGDAAPKGKLALTTAGALLAGGASGPAVVPGKAGESLLLEMVSGDEPEMPRKGEKLSAAEVAGLRAWIDQGAPWPEGLTLSDRRFDGQSWWAFEPLKRPVFPAVKARGWLRTPIDAFVLKALEEKGLEPSPEADRRTLIRRLTYDLHGLPPTPDEIDAFLDDPRPAAYETLVDRLLASPRYGERWGRHWLDVAHYGDTHGYDKDKRRDHAWPYRDYVIRSFNDDLPYGRFVAEQVAGDVLAPGDPNGVAATGFVAAGPWDFVGHVELREGTVDKAKARLIDRDDMVTNVFSAFQSLTVGCARCHDHKFDPIPQREYYRLQAVFAGVERGDRATPTPEAAALLARKAGVEARLKALKGKAAAATGPELAPIRAELAALNGRLAAQAAAQATVASPSNGYHGPIAATADAEQWVQVDLGRAQAIDLVRLVPARPTDFPDTPGFGFPARFRIELGDDPSLARAAQVADRTSSDFANPGDEPVVFRADRNTARFVRVTATRLWPRTGDYVFALGELEVISGGRNVARGAAVSASGSIEAGRWSRANLVDGFDSRGRLAQPDDPGQAEGTRERRALRRAIALAERRLREIHDSLVDAPTKAGLQRASAELADVESKLKSLPAPALVYSVVPHAPRPIHLLNRGDVESPGELMTPGGLTCLPGLDPDFGSSAPDDEGGRRASLARWIAGAGNVLTWRSIANRVWHHHFGRGIVDTPNDFGRNGSRPTHPELLDWLAVELLENGQSLKALHRTIVRSAVYRQSSRANPAAEAIDADARFLWRMNRRRLDAESIRDGVLAVAGVLDPAMGGPAFEPFRFKDDHSPVYDHADPGRIDHPSARRRAVYRFAVRSVPDPFLDCLDGADPNIATPVRSTTITALQALALWNDLFMLRQAERFAHRLEAQAGGDPHRQIEAAYRLALGRLPRQGERDALAAFAARHGLPSACRLLFNTNEFVFVD